MEGKALILVFLSGLCFLPGCVPRNYIIVKEPKTWAEAQSYCREKYTDLAIVDNKEDLDRLVVATQPFYTGLIWIGLYDDINGWKWSLDKEGYYGEEEAGYRRWMSGHPNNVGSYQNCAQMTAQGWNDLPCYQKFNFVCYNETKTSPSFIVVPVPKSWKDAQSYCRKHHTDLASVRNKAENDQLQNMIGTNAWIGLYRDSWKWTDGRPPSFNNWLNGEPNGNNAESCVFVSHGRWGDYRCHNKLYFACSLVNKQLVRVKMVKKDSSVNLEDAADAILEQLNRMLKALSEDIKLTWKKQPDGKIFHLEKKEAKKKK